MRNLPGALGVSLLLALLTWLLLRGIDFNAPAYAATLRAFDDYALAEASLHRDVLQARTGLLRDYDSLVSAAQAMEEAVGRLRDHAQIERLDAAAVDLLEAAVVRQEELMERFKTSNALLQNSLSYIGLPARARRSVCTTRNWRPQAANWQRRSFTSRATHRRMPSRRSRNESISLRRRRPR